MRSGKKYCSAGRRRLKIIVIAGIIAFFLGGFAIGAAYLLIYSKAPAVHSLKVQGNRTLSSQLIASLIQEEVVRKGGWRSFLGAENIAFWTFKKEGFGDKSFHPWIKQVSVREDILKKEVDIDVLERKIFAILCLPRQCYGLDEDGVSFTKVPGAAGYLIRIIFDENERKILLGKPAFNDAFWVGIRDIANELQGSGFGVGTIEIRDDELGEWTAETAAGPKLIFSVFYSPASVLEVLRKLAKKMDLKKVEEIDFRVPEKVYYR